jgi:hypothetical protein
MANGWLVSPQQADSEASAEVDGHGPVTPTVFKTRTKRRF